MIPYWNITDGGYQFSYVLPDDTIDRKIIRNELEMLFVDGTIDKSNDSFIISHEIAASFLTSQREILQLPEIFPFSLNIRSKSDEGHDDFGFSLSFLKSDDTPFVNPKVIGSYIQITDDTYYMFNLDQYNLVKTVMECNTQSQNIRNKIDLMDANFRYVAKVKQYSKKVQAVLDKYIEQENIITPDVLNIKIQQNRDGSYQVIPVLLNETEYGYKSVTDDIDFVQQFQKRKVKGSYITENGIYVFSPEQKEALGEIREIPKLNTEEAKRIESQPKERLNSPAFLFNEDDYADRVVGIGDFIHKSLPYIKLQKEGWLPEEGTSLGCDKNKSEYESPIGSLDMDALWDFKAKIRQAIKEEKKSLSFKNHIYPVTHSLVEKIDNAIALINAENKDDRKVDHGDKAVNDSNKALLIHDNFEELNYHVNVREKCMALHLKEDIFDGLRHTITLFPYQKEGVLWIESCWQHGYKGVLLADDMGLGKTAQAYAFISGLKVCMDDRDLQSILIVAPVSLLKNWKEEFVKFVKPNIFDDVIEIYGDKINTYKYENRIDLSSIAMNNIILTTYETLRSFQLSFGLINWSIMIIDEAQKIKNPTAMTTNAIKAMQYEFGIALTGTPVENSWVDLWSILDFVAPGRMSSLKEFNVHYQNKLNNLVDNIPALKKLGTELQSQIAPIYKRRLKKDYLENLPKKYIEKVREPMPDVQQNAYEMIIQNAKNNHSAFQKDPRNKILQTIAQLRDVSLCPNIDVYNDKAFIQMDVQEVIHSSARLCKTFEILHDIKTRDEKVLIFVTSRKMQRILKYLLERVFDIIVPTPINGQMISERRQQIVTAFNESSGFGVLILSAEAGGVGFNITSANNIIHLSRCWNPAKEDQATDRVYRIGQEKDVHVYIPIAWDSTYGEGASFDEKLDKLLDYKRNLSESVLFPTGDSEKDGFKIFQDILKSTPVAKENNSQYWTIDEMRKLNGEAFELVICSLYNQMKELSAQKTGYSNDKGADIVVLNEDETKHGLLIQCKQTSTNNNMGSSGVEAICSAIKYYENIYSCNFDGVVVTNAKDFTMNTKIRARCNNITLIANKELGELLLRYPVKKFF